MSATRLRQLGIALCCLGALACCALFAYAYLNSKFHFYDDEGYLLLSIRNYASGQPLYDAVFTQYGPFYYLVRGNWELTHDQTRLLTVLFWLGASALLAAFFYHATGDWALGIVVFLATASYLRELANEPGHPQELILVVLGLALLAPFGAAGPAGAGLALTKLNVGVFFIAGLGLWSGRWWIRAAICLLPAALMFRHPSWMLGIATVSMTLVAWKASAPGTPAVSGRKLLLAAIGFAAAAGLIIAATLARGTTPAALWRAVVMRPMGQADAFYVPLDVHPAAVALAVVSAGLAFFSARPSMNQGMNRAMNLGLKLAAGAGVLGLAMGPRGWMLQYGSPWLWLLLVPPPDRRKWTQRDQAPRALVTCLAVTQILQAYPVAGTQLVIGTVLMIPWACLAIHDGLAAVPKWRMAAAGVAACAFLVFMNAPGVWIDYDVREPLDLPGAHDVRLSPEETERYRALVAALKENCDTFLSMPGYNSLYFWTRLWPPTTVNTTDWMFLLDDKEQQQIVDGIPHGKRVCALYHEEGVRFWLWGRPIEQVLAKPLARYIASLPKLKEIDGYELRRTGP